MSEPSDRQQSADEAFRSFAMERSHRDGEVANETWRVSAQITILINGAAASALVTLMSADKAPKINLRFLPYCVLGYAIGVICGAIMAFATMKALTRWNEYWRARAFPTEGNAAEFHQSAVRWQFVDNSSFVVSILCFVGVSCFLPWVLS